MKRTASVVSSIGPVQELQSKPDAWKALQHHYRKLRTFQLGDAFAHDPARGKRLSAEGAGLYLDYSKNLITDQTIRLLVRLAKDSGLASRIDAMFRGEKINITENQAAMHIGIRAPKGAPIFVGGKDIVPEVQAVLNRMTYFANSIRRGEWKGHTGKRIRNVVSIGTGGCALGPAVVFEALKPYSDRSMLFRFVSDVDSSDFAEAVRDLQADETLFIVCSRNFKSLETMMNARLARLWLTSAPGWGEESISKHFVGISNNADEVTQFGIGAATMFPFWNWLGDAYSVGSPISLSTMIAIGPENFGLLLNGLHEMDMHFLTTPFEYNLPVLMGLLAIWYVNFFGMRAIAVLPYERHLCKFPEYLQQLTMQSNGKHITLIGTEVTRSTSPVYFGASGTTGQHLFAQFLQQAKDIVPCDLIVFGKSSNPLESHHDVLVANALSQAEVLAFGNKEQIKAGSSPDWLEPHQLLSGNRPSSVILAAQLNPSMLGKLIALYEHSVFTQGVIWNINSFDKWAESLSEILAQQNVTDLESQTYDANTHDSSTSELIRRYRMLRNES